MTIAQPTRLAISGANGWPKQVGLAVFAVAAIVWALAGCGTDADAEARPGQRRQTEGPVAGAERVDGKATSLRPASGLLLGVPVYEGDFADPYVLRVGDSFYAYSTNSDDANVPLLVVKGNLAAEYLGDALPKLPGWSDPGFVWAPAVLASDEGYVLYYVTRLAGTETQCISRATATTPSGPFADDSEEPLVCQRDLGGSIDPSIVTDRDGTHWLLFKNDGNCCELPTSLWSQRLSPDGRSLVGEPARLLDARQGWEGELIEGPSMVVTPEDYLLFYSANAWDSEDYAIGWARCESVSGRCERAGDDPWMDSTTFARGPGGQEFFGALGEVWMVYHGWERGDLDVPGAQRRLYVDVVEVDDGEPRRVGARNSGTLLVVVIVVLLLAGTALLWWWRKRRSTSGGATNPRPRRSPGRDGS